MITIYYAHTDLVTDSNRYEIIERLSPKAKAKLQGLKREEDKLLVLTSSMLLLKVLSVNNYFELRLSDLQYTFAGRPFFANAPFDFNSSHTDGCVAIAFCKNNRVGIDIEKIREIDIADYEKVFPSEIWQIICQSEDIESTFYKYWTLIESAVKADGRGLPLLSSSKIEILKDQICIDNKIWYYNHHKFDPSISCSVSSIKQNIPIQIIELRSPNVL